MTLSRSRKDDEHKVPNFTALREWFDKLETWAEDIVQDVKNLERESKARLERINELESQLADVQYDEIAFDTLFQGIIDVDRGIRDFPELLRTVRQMPYVEH